MKEVLDELKLEGLYAENNAKPAKKEDKKDKKDKKEKKRDKKK